MNHLNLKILIIFFLFLLLNIFYVISFIINNPLLHSHFLHLKSCIYCFHFNHHHLQINFHLFIQNLKLKDFNFSYFFLFYVFTYNDYSIYNSYNFIINPKSIILTIYFFNQNYYYSYFNCWYQPIKLNY